MRIPEKVIDHKISPAGSTETIGTGEVTLPVLTNITETLKGPGIAGEYDSPTDGFYQAMKSTISFKTLLGDVTALYVAEGFEARGAIQVFDNVLRTQVLVPIQISIRGKATTLDSGRLMSGEGMDVKVEYEVFYYKLVIDGKTVIEVDKFAYKATINGKDLLKPLRQALGME